MMELFGAVKVLAYGHHARRARRAGLNWRLESRPHRQAGKPALRGGGLPGGKNS
jgi:hypothetical protein